MKTFHSFLSETLLMLSHVPVHVGPDKVYIFGGMKLEQCRDNRN